MFAILLSVSGLAYASALILFMWGLSRHRRGTSTERPRVSVLVAAKDEAANIRDCVEALGLQRYPHDRYEVIIVDDHSRDGTYDMATSAARGYANVRVVRSTGGGEAPGREMASGKMRALTCGVEASGGDILALTDADCRPGPDWLSTIVSNFDDGVGLVAGYSPFLPMRGHSLRQLEPVVSAFISAGSIGIGWPLACAGRNLAYRRVVYDEVGGYARLSHRESGDDSYLLRLVASETDWEIRFAPEPESFVPTVEADVDVGTFVDQKKRHASKAARFGGGALVLGLVAYLFNLVLFGGVVLAPLKVLPAGSTVAGLLGKIMVDSMALFRTRRFFRFKLNALWFPIASLLLVPYIVVFAGLGALTKYRWKSRTGAATPAAMGSAPSADTHLELSR